jgi:Asp-tRNA(Asn)/Glu-tRNA(Gln) amidotransferase C subunit
MNIGDKVKIVAQIGHVYKIGEFVEICGFMGDYIIVIGKSKYTSKKIKNLLTKNQIKVMKQSVTVTDVMNTANQLCVANNTATTLEIKNKLRKDFPNKSCTQQFVSDTMRTYANNGLFTFTDNGSYRTYSRIWSGTTSNKSITLTNNKTVKPMTSKRISRSSALNMIENSKGQFFTVEFTKQDGTLRKLNGQYVKDQKKSNLGYVLVKESGKLKKGEKNPIRNVNIQTLKSLSIHSETYKIRN